MKSLTTLLLLLLAAPVAFARGPAVSGQQVQALLDSGQIETAIDSLDRRIRKNARDSEALFLRSTAHIMRGDFAAGRRDLEACLEIDPAKRQAWLNRAALDLAEEDFAGAVDAFSRAETLDPGASDNSLNIGAALLLGGHREQASQRFRRYLKSNAGDAGAYYLVAANYAMAARPALVVPLLKRAIQLDERTRLKARTDANFAVLVDDPDFQELLNSDNYRFAPGAFTASRSYGFTYTGRDSRVLDATLTALQRGGYPISSGVEVTPLWSLIWSDVRVKITANQKGGTDVVLSSDSGSYTPEAWQAKTDDLFRRIALELSSRLPQVDRERPGSQ